MKLLHFDNLTVNPRALEAVRIVTEYDYLYGKMAVLEALWSGQHQWTELARAGQAAADSLLVFRREIVIEMETREEAWKRRG